VYGVVVVTLPFSHVIAPPAGAIAELELTNLTKEKASFLQSK